MHDISFIQNYLTHTRDNDPSLSSSSSWKYQFLWLNDMFAKLSSHHFVSAQAYEPQTFRSYFARTLLDTIRTKAVANTFGANLTDVLSTSFAHMASHSCNIDFSVIFLIYIWSIKFDNDANSGL